MRVHELAKKYNKTNKEILELLNNLGIEVKSHLSKINEDALEIITDELETSKKSEKQKEAKKLEETVLKKEEKTISKPKEDKKSQGTKEENDIKVIKIIGDEITLKEFAEQLKLNPTDLIKKLFLKGKMFTINSVLSYEQAEELALEYDALIEKEEVVEESFGEKFSLEEKDKEENLEERAPIITIMGHVDHGKTSLLDTIRKTNVAGGEAGGITQKIGAYQVERHGKKITFIDTPGHEAFTEMRARGAEVTDIAILIVAADDGVKPQTIEAISHAKAAEVPIIVAINKIDKPGADPTRVRTELMEYGLIAPEWGGDTEFVEISAKFNKNIDMLLETILLTAEILELKADFKKRAKGIVLESRLDPKLGPVADVLIKEGNLKVGEVFVCDETFGKVRALINDKGERVNKVYASQPVEILGFDTVPNAGDVLYAIKNEKQAKKIVEEVIKQKKLKEQNRTKHVSLESFSKQLEAEKLKELKLILRADSGGSVEALKDSLNKLSNDEVAVNIIQAAAGAITEGDIMLAEASDAIIIGFHVRPTTKAIKAAEKAGVEIRTHNVIYHITEEIEKALTGMLEPEFKEVYLGRIEIKKVFKISKVGNIAGCLVEDGKVRKTSNVRILRNNIVIYDGKLASLKRYQNDANEVVAGQECGLHIENFNDIKEGDVVEAYELEEVKRTLR
ncbi:translation initiation factor IF-2 [Hypnocyclicus thermotrophus]|uniref:Translation initiation factor IF-2 n=1 Tax=Hypnocyclicus thermotrophus TaxID=1627895 RepID=A0AA46DYN7_9FUSO|nr:translation initiation factor IF-2 [Hypnocyclicus thermotrophus]